MCTTNSTTTSTDSSAVLLRGGITSTYVWYPGRYILELVLRTGVNISIHRCVKVRLEIATRQRCDSAAVQAIKYRIFPRGRSALLQRVLSSISVQ
jgi:hypothetical protein